MKRQKAGEKRRDDREGGKEGNDRGSRSKIEEDDRAERTTETGTDKTERATETRPTDTAAGRWGVL